MMIAQAIVTLSQHDLLTEDECADIARRVVRLRPHWTRRSDGGFYSLGAAAYLDSPRQVDAYPQAARRTNGLLLRAFSDLYRNISGFLEALLGEDVKLDETRAAPGFHIFEFHGADRGRDDPAPRAHFDLQWQYAYPGQTPTGTLSFTLLIEAPSGGAAMAVWNMRYEDTQFGGNSRDYATRHNPQRVDYAPGRLVIHDGLILHAIGAARTGRLTGQRITLQGHGVRFDKGWRLYW
jgi:hypothetical protein